MKNVDIARIINGRRATRDEEATLRRLGVGFATLTGFILVNVDNGRVTTATLWNMFTDEVCTFVAYDVDRDANPYAGVLGMGLFGGSREVERMWRRSCGLITEGDEVEVFKGRKYPVGLRVTVKEFYTYRDHYGRERATYVVATTGERIPLGNCKLVR